MKKKIILSSVIALFVFIAGACAYYFLAVRAAKPGSKPTACTMEAKICPDGSVVSRGGQDCAFAPCPVASTDDTAGWKTAVNDEYGLRFKYPSGFFQTGQEPKIFSGACDYQVFPDRCPIIDELIIKEEQAAGSDAGAIRSNLASPDYWVTKGGKKLTINDVPYCLYQTKDAAMGHAYDSYYYVTVKDQKCLIANFVTATTNCDFYLPLESGNAEQKKNYEECLAANQARPKILDKILSTFKLAK